MKQIYNIISSYIDVGLLREILEAVVLVLFFVTAWLFYRKLDIGSKLEVYGTKTLGRITADESFFKWNERLAKMKANGTLYRSPWMSEPYKYLLVHLIIGTLLNIAVAILIPRYLIIAIIPAYIIGWEAIELYNAIKNRGEENAMLSDVTSISNALTIEITGNSYIGRALAECSDIVHHPRLKTALSEFNIAIESQTMSIKDAVNDFNSKFQMTEINVLCTIIRQGLETGRMTDCSTGLAKQCMRNREAVFLAVKGKVERICTYAILLIFISAMIFMLVQFLTTIEFESVV